MNQMRCHLGHEAFRVSSIRFNDGTSTYYSLKRTLITIILVCGGRGSKRAATLFTKPFAYLPFVSTMEPAHTIGRFNDGTSTYYWLKRTVITIIPVCGGRGGSHSVTHCLVHEAFCVPTIRFNDGTSTYYWLKRTVCPIILVCGGRGGSHSVALVDLLRFF
eukprot:g5373.t1